VRRWSASGDRERPRGPAANWSGPVCVMIVFSVAPRGVATASDCSQEVYFTRQGIAGPALTLSCTGFRVSAYPVDHRWA